VRPETWGYGKVDELIGHLKWRLARDPISYSFHPSPKLKTRQAFTEELAETVPMMWVFFVIVSDDLVSLLWIENADDAPPLGFDDWLGVL
jgi:hypothetical protein